MLIGILFIPCKQNLALYQRIIDEGYSKEADYMIVATGMENTHCVPVAKENLRVGDFAFYIGYPGKEEFNVLGRPFWTSGLVPAFSSGNIVDGLMNTPRGKQLIAAIPGMLSGFEDVRGYQPGVNGGANISHIVEKARSQVDQNTFSQVFDCKDQ